MLGFPFLTRLLSKLTRDVFCWGTILERLSSRQFVAQFSALASIRDEGVTLEEARESGIGKAVQVLVKQSMHVPLQNLSKKIMGVWRGQVPSGSAWGGRGSVGTILGGANSSGSARGG